MTLSRVPPWLQHAVLSRGEWSACALERSCFGPMHEPTPAAPFHHLAVRLDRAPMKMGWTSDGRRYETDLPHDHVSIIPAGASVTSWWDRPVDFACLYFTSDAVHAAVDEELVRSSRWELRPMLAVQAPSVSMLIRAIAKDTQLGQPFGRMRGDALFQQLATLLAVDRRLVLSRDYKDGVGDRRVRRALDYIHAHLSEELDLQRIAAAAETSVFHLSRLFRQKMGYPIWRYVSRLRVQMTIGLMKDPLLTLAQVAALSGFSSYSTFAATFRAEQGLSPLRYKQLR